MTACKDPNCGCRIGQAWPGGSTANWTYPYNPDTGLPAGTPWRVFPSGATRDSDADKLDYAGFLSPLVLQAYATYMHRHRFMGDGTMREADNWKKGIPREEAFRPMMRHVMDLWLHMEGQGAAAREPLEDALAAVMFNVQSVWLDVIRQRTPTPSA